MYNSKIIGLGKYLPSNVVTNSDLEKIMDTSDEWIQERTGIKERRHIKKGSDDSTSSMGVKASKIALERSGIDAKEIDLILFATFHSNANPLSKHVVAWFTVRLAVK